MRFRPLEVFPQKHLRSQCLALYWMAGRREGHALGPADVLAPGAWDMMAGGLWEENA